MASIELIVPTPPDERRFARILLRYAQQLARMRAGNRPTELRYRWRKRSRLVPYRHYSVSVEGDFAEIQAFCIELNGALHHFGRGMAAATPELSRSLLPALIPAALLNSVLDMTEEIARVARAAIGLGAPVVVNSLVFVPTGQEDVDRHLGALSQTLLHGRNGRLVPGVLAEQAHTATELMLKKVLRLPNQGKTFSGLVAAAESASLITAPEAIALTNLKDMRRDGKHRGHSVSESQLVSVLPATVGVLQRLVASLVLQAEG